VFEGVEAEEEAGGEVVELVADGAGEGAEGGEAVGADELVDAAGELAGEVVALALAQVAQGLEAEEVADAREQLALVDGLGEEVVAARVLGAHPRVAVAVGRDEHHRQLGPARVGAQAAAGLHAVDAGHHHVEEHEVDRAGVEGLEARLAARGLDGGVALGGEDGVEQHAVARLVVDDEDDRGGHAGASRGAARRVRVNTDPRPGALRSVRVPSMWRTRARVRARPMPDPRSDAGTSARACSRYSNTRSRSVAAMPGPSSSTSIATRP
jgi:hypothetical protein